MLSLRVNKTWIQWLMLTVVVTQLSLSEGLTVKICIPYQKGEERPFREQCKDAVSLANTDDLEFVCVEGGSADACIDMLTTGEAHLTTLDGSDVIAANRDHGIAPLISEQTGFGVAGGAYYAVAVVNEEFCKDRVTLADLKGTRSCHTGFRKSAGWKIPVGTLSIKVEDFLAETPSKGNIENDAELVANFFDGVCAPRTSGNGPKNTNDGEGELWDDLCSSCKGDCSTNDQFYDYSGAFRCLMEGNGDVAFVKHSTVLNYAADGAAHPVKRDWANRTMDEFRLLCRTGGCAEVTDFAECHLSLAPGHALVTTKDLAYRGENETIGFDIQNALLDASEETEFLNETKGLIPNFLWSDGTTRLHSTPRGMESYLPEESLATFDAFDAILEPSTNLSAIYCAISDDEFDFCEEIVEAASEISPDTEWGCIKRNSTDECLAAILAGDADWRTVSGSGAYDGFANYELTSIIAEDGALYGGYEYYSVAVVHEEFCEENENATIADLEGKRSCHTGYRRNAGWDIPLGAFIARNVMTIKSSNPAIANDAETAASFFNGSCAPSRTGVTPQNFVELPYPPLCSICKDSCGENSPYFGYKGAHQCLADGAGDVAFVKHTTVFDFDDQHDRESLRLLCPSPRAGCASVDDYEACNLGRVPARSVVVSSNNRNQEQLKETLLSTFKENGFQDLVFSPSQNPEDFIFRATGGEFVDLEDGTEVFLESTLNIFEALERLDAAVSEIVKVCIPYSATPVQVEECEDLFTSANIPNIGFQCIAGGSAVECMTMLFEGDAHLTSLDGGDIFHGHCSYGVVPLVSEVGKDWTEGTYYSVAVVNKDFCEDEDVTLADLQGQRSCHTGYRKMAGWRVPVGTLLSDVDDFTVRATKGNIEDDAELVANFFDGVCAPRTSGNGPKNTDDGEGELWDDLCSSCKGDCSTNDQFYDYSGAFRCLMEGNGDVAFVKHSTVLNYAADGAAHPVKRDWANRTMDEFRLLCRTGGCASVTDYEDCHLALVPSHAIVGAAVLGEDGKLAEVGKAIQNGLLRASRDLDFFDKARGFLNEFPFSSSTESVAIVEGGYDGYITEEAQSSLLAFDDLIGGSCGSSTEAEYVFCATNDAQMKACESNADLFSEIDPDVAWKCEQQVNIDACFASLEEGDVHYVAATADEIARRYEEYGLKTIAAEAVGENKETDIYSVVVVDSAECSNERLYFSDYASTSACFTGLDSDSGWNVPISIMASQGLISIVNRTTEPSNAVASIAQFFTSICVPHDEDPDFDQNTLCSACEDECTTSGSYAGSKGAIDCMLAQENGIAVTDNAAFLDDFDLEVSLLCPYRTGCEPIEGYGSCNFGKTPTDAIVVSDEEDSAMISTIQKVLIAASTSKGYTSLLNMTRAAGELVAVEGSTENFLGDYEDSRRESRNIESTVSSSATASVEITEDDADLLSDGKRPSLHSVYFITLFSLFILILI